MGRERPKSQVLDRVVQESLEASRNRPDAQEQVRSLRDRKVQTLEARQPSVIISGNIGCIQHLQSGTQLPVKHWVEVIDEVLAAG